MKIRESFTCPLEIIMDMIRGKWKTIIIWRLRLGRTSLAKLKKDIKGITEKMLLENLKELIEVGVVKKDEFEGYPLKVEYYLTNRGVEIITALKIIQKIGIDYMLEIGKKQDLINLGLIDSTNKKVGN